MLAAEHRSHNRFSDALHISRRILEGLPTEPNAKTEELDRRNSRCSRRRAQEEVDLGKASKQSAQESQIAFKRRHRFKRLGFSIIVLGGRRNCRWPRVYSKKLIPPRQSPKITLPQR